MSIISSQFCTVLEVLEGPKNRPLYEIARCPHLDKHASIGTTSSDRVSEEAATGRFKELRFHCSYICEKCDTNLLSFFCSPLPQSTTS